AATTIVQVGHVVEAGELDSEAVVTPGIHVDRIVRGAVMIAQHLDRGPLGQDELARVLARDIPPGSYVNLGIGRPTTVGDHITPESGVILHTENGMLGMGPRATGDAIDPDLINAGKIPVTELPGAAY